MVTDTIEKMREGERDRELCHHATICTFTTYDINGMKYNQVKHADELLI